MSNQFYDMVQEVAGYIPNVSIHNIHIGNDEYTVYYTSNNISCRARVNKALVNFFVNKEHEVKEIIHHALEMGIKYNLYA